MLWLPRNKEEDLTERLSLKLAAQIEAQSALGRAQEQAKCAEQIQNRIQLAEAPSTDPEQNRMVELEAKMLELQKELDTAKLAAYGEHQFEDACNCTQPCDCPLFSQRIVSHTCFWC